MMKEKSRSPPKLSNGRQARIKNYNHKLIKYRKKRGKTIWK
ncbi:conserved hypothetical protein [Clostridioides difficile CD002]|nr:conserved hypothetical protein [Clostridioides difficile CD002]CCL09460.1 conserved hypothetical protein [Clostridioides difficile E16]CCL41019.1 conserved hypothetical protein [Clostridioides difficile E24]CCL44980.1 conserved hypothetical protein [Clostridioides difficile T42]CCL51021.1 conserved hypothetical protein [Clostridioides difficile T6]CCL54763.1 conserved hypothetical protein [Clostridioides difficile E14]CCL58270.1 conserved hypothetical protein [Clostridioides difficile T17]